MQQKRAKGEREGGCPAPTGGEHLTDSGLRLVGASGVARPCRTAGLNRGGWDIDGWAPTTLEGGGG
jgi:hypothetical protein